MTAISSVEAVAGLQHLMAEEVRRRHRNHSQLQKTAHGVPATKDDATGDPDLTPTACRILLITRSFAYCGAAANFTQRDRSSQDRTSPRADRRLPRSV